MTGEVKQKTNPLPKQVTKTVTPERGTSASGFDTTVVMAAFRQAVRNRGWRDRGEIVREVAEALGYQRVGARLKELLKGHLRAAIRRGIIEAEGTWVRALTATMHDYTREELRNTLISVMRKGTTYEREDVIYAIAHHLGFSRVTDAMRDLIKSAINSGIRQGILGYEGSVIWRGW